MLELNSLDESYSANILPNAVAYKCCANVILPGNPINYYGVYGVSFSGSTLISNKQKRILKLRFLFFLTLLNFKLMLFITVFFALGIAVKILLRLLFASSLKFWSAAKKKICNGKPDP
jgi:hypothetical protein